MTDRPAFSIVVPTYQRRELVSDAVRAICSIDYDGSFDLIVVIDGSTDGTEASLADIQGSFPRRIIVQANAGAAAARNRGAVEASGDILLFLDDDMMCRADILQRHARSYRAGADAVLGDVPLDPESPDTFLARAAGRWADQRSTALKGGAVLSPFDVISGHISIRRSVFEAVGGFDPSYTSGGSYGGEDIDFGVRLLDACKVVFNPDAVASQRYVIAAGQYLRQWKEAGRADVHFARKHPSLADQLFTLRGSRRLKTRLLRRVAASRVLSSATCAASLWSAEREKYWPRPLRRLLAHSFLQTRDIAYWRGVREAGS